MKFLLPALLLVLLPTRVFAQPLLLPDKTIVALSSELSGESAKRNLELLTREHRMRGSRGFHVAAEHIVRQLHSYGIANAIIETFPADGVRYYGTQKSRRPWNAEFAELWDLGASGEGSDPVRIASWEAMPISLAQDSASGQALGELIDVGAGISESDYTGKSVEGKLVLTSSQPGTVVPLAVAKFKAAGVVSYAQNQKTAWWGENENLVRWGHLDTFSATPAFAFMVSPRQARLFQARILAGQAVWLKADVRAGQSDGAYEVVTATIPGSDPVLRDQEIVFSCHLDHPRPGANDNASGAAAILEIARTLSRLIAEQRIERPARTIRFIWPPEIEGTLAFLSARPDVARNIKAAIHMDMVGGGPETKAIFHVTRGPASLPSFFYDVAGSFAHLVNRESSSLARTGLARFPLASAEGGREALQAEVVPLTLGSDHQVYSDSSFAIPAIELNDWPDRFIHTNFDLPSNIDPTKLRRTAFIAAATGYYLAGLRPAHAKALVAVVQASAVRRTAVMLENRTGLDRREAGNLTRWHLDYEWAVIDSIRTFVEVPPEVKLTASSFLVLLESMVGKPERPQPVSGSGAVVFRRNVSIKGPMEAFGYDYALDKLGEQKHKALRLLSFEGLRGSGEDYSYEVLNLADGKRSVSAIRDAVSAIYGPVPMELVEEYLRALASIDVVQLVR